MRLRGSILGLGAVTAPVCSLLAPPTAAPLGMWHAALAPSGFVPPPPLGALPRQGPWDARRATQGPRRSQLLLPLPRRSPARVALGVRMRTGGVEGAGAAPEASVALAPLRVYLFVAFVGWGKNKMTDLIEGMEGGQREALLGEGAAQHTVVIESDVVGGKRFWGEVDKRIKAQPSMTHLILNKNFPPGAWEGTLRKLKASCEANRRSLELYAIVPHSTGTERNAFTLIDLAVSIYSVLQRGDHPNLSSKSPTVVQVAVLFYRLYVDLEKSGREGFLERVRTQLTPRVVCVEWQKARSEWGGQGPAAQCEGLMRKVLSKLRKGVPDETVAALEREVRSFMRRPDVCDFMTSVRLPPEEVLLSFQNGLRAAEQGTEGA